MRFGSVCSGIEAASVAWIPLGWMPAWFSEIEPFPSQLLEYHYPATPNLGDMTMLPQRIRDGEIEAPDVFCGGTPCQAFSVAGKRQSLDDERGNLSLIFCEIANAIDDVRTRSGQQPAIIFWENVPGVLNTKDNAFGCFLAELAGEPEELQPTGKKWSNAGLVLGPKRTIAWRILDAQYFGVAQRRRRVFVVASARAEFDPAEILFEFDGVRRDTAPSRKTGQEVATTTGSGSEGRRGPALGQNGFRMTAFGEYADDETALTMKARDYKDATDLVSYTLFEPRSADGVPRISPDQTLCPTLNTMSGGQREPCIAFNSRQDPVSGDVFGGLDACSPQAQAIATKENRVRRLTPRECERLQGFPDDYTQIPWGGKLAAKCPDGHRYKALGNSWAIPVVRWIGRRICNILKKG